MKDQNLHTRQFRLYNYLKGRGDEWTTQLNIAIALRDVYPLDEYEIMDFHNSTARHQITNDIRALNKSGMIQKLILSGAKGVKIANKEEFAKYISKQINAAVRRLQYVKQMCEKANRDGQYRITMGEYERDVIEAFLK